MKNGVNNRYGGRDEWFAFHKDAPQWIRHDFIIIRRSSPAVPHPNAPIVSRGIDGEELARRLAILVAPTPRIAERHAPNPAWVKVVMDRDVTLKAEHEIWINGHETMLRIILDGPATRTEIRDAIIDATGVEPHIVIAHVCPKMAVSLRFAY